MAGSVKSNDSYIINIGWATVAVILVLAIFALAIYWFRWPDLLNYAFLGITAADYVVAGTALLLFYLLFRQHFHSQNAHPAHATLLMPLSPIATGSISLAIAAPQAHTAILMPLASPGLGDWLIAALVIALIAAVCWEYFSSRKKKGKAKVKGSESEEKGNGSKADVQKGAGGIAAGQQKSSEATEEGKGEESNEKNRDVLSLSVLLLLAAIIGRVALEFRPSVEPVIPIAIAAALVVGPAAGALIGALGYAISNIFMLGGIWGIWTVWQAIGAAVPAAVVGLMRRNEKPTTAQLVTYTFFATIVFEIVINVGMALDFNIGYFVSALPFSIAHIVSNVVIAMLISPVLNKWKG